MANHQKYKQPNFYLSRHTTSEQKQDHIDSLLESECTRNKAEPWNKLGKTSKLKVINNYVESEMAPMYVLSPAETAELKEYLNQCLDKKRIQHVKDVVYDKELGKLTGIHHLIFNTGSRKFTLKRIDKELEKKRTTVKVKSVPTAAAKLSGGAAVSAKRKRVHEEPPLALATAAATATATATAVDIPATAVDIPATAVDIPASAVEHVADSIFVTCIVEHQQHYVVVHTAKTRPGLPSV